MNKVISKRFFSDNVAELVVEAPLIARSRKAGHFVIVRVDEKGERMPLTISDADTEKGVITLVVQRIGVSSAKLCQMEVGDYIADVVGPLGKATNIQNYGTVVCACGGVGAAPMLPIAQALKAAGNKVITVLAARNKDLIILKDELERCSDEVIVMTDDGSMGKQGVVTVGVEDVIRREKVDKCVTIGPAIMMKFVALTTKKYNIPTEASLNTIMVDGTGMCGACRVTVAGKTRFVCVDGPEFDAHEVDFDQMLSRLTSYKTEEAQAYETYLHTSMVENDHSRDAQWRTDLRRAIKPKERLAIERVQMPELDPAYRATKLYEEVNCGLTKQMAVQEAKRCLDCANPRCVEGCPVHIDIPSFIKHIEKEDVLGAAKVIKQSSTLPAVCGRVCPQEKQCESQCIHHSMNSKPVAIGYLERFAADTALEQNITIASQSVSTGIKIAVVGSGPAGLTFAGDMVKLGYQVTVFEALHEIGGVLKYGIPEYRLPNRIVEAEIDSLRQQGVEFMTDVVVGKTLTMDYLRENFAGIFVATGAGLPRFMDIAGENLNGVLSSNEYLTRVNLMGAANNETDTPLLYGKRVMVVGGGNTAMDAVRTAKRLGAERAIIVYRRSEEEMPARIEEVRHAKEEGIEFLTLHNPLEYIGDEKGRVCKAILQVMTLGDADESGRRSPVAIDDCTEELEVDMVVVAVGVSPNPLIPSSVDGLEISRRGTIVVNEQQQSSIPMIFAGGDISRGGATVILAMSDGRKAAAEMHTYLNEKNA